MHGRRVGLTFRQSLSKRIFWCREPRKLADFPLTVSSNEAQHILI